MQRNFTKRLFIGFNSAAFVLLWMLNFTLNFWVRFICYYGAHEFVGAQLSVLALVIGAVYFERVLNLFRVQNACYWVVPFMLWPSLLTRATTVMREPILICLTVMIVYYLLQYRRDERQLNAVYAIALCLVAALIHKAYAVLVIFIVPYILFFLMKQKERFYQSGVFYSRIVLGVAFGGLLWVVYKQLGNVRGLEPHACVGVRRHRLHAGGRRFKDGEKQPGRHTPSVSISVPCRPF